MAYQKRVSYRGIGLDNAYAINFGDRIFYAINISNFDVVVTKQLPVADITLDDFEFGMEEDFPMAVMRDGYGSFAVEHFNNEWIIVYSDNGKLQIVKWSDDTKTQTQSPVVIQGEDAFLPLIFRDDVENRWVILFADKLDSGKYYSLETDDWVGFSQFDVSLDPLAQRNSYLVNKPEINIEFYMFMAAQIDTLMP